MKKIYLSGSYGEGAFVLVDADDFVKFKYHKWYLGKNGYATESSKRNLLHHLIMNRIRGDGTFVDHTNGDKLDCRKSNLRIALKGENLRNVKKRANNTSGYKGVHFYKRHNKFVAFIRVDYKRKHLGYFMKAEDAALAYNKAAKEYFGDFANLNMI